MGLKRDILGACSGAAPPEAVIVSNTSSLPINDLAEFVGRPERFCGMHWFNPPEWTPGVEVIPAKATAEETVERVVGFLRGVGKRPAVVGDGPGFVANRIQNALFLEAVRCVEEGLASPQEVDEVVRSCFGFRLPFFGPFQIADMAGLDVYESVLGLLGKMVWARGSRLPKALRELVDQGNGQKPRAAQDFSITPKRSATCRCSNATGATRRLNSCWRSCRRRHGGIRGGPMIDTSVLVVGAGASRRRHGSEDGRAGYATSRSSTRTGNTSRRCAVQDSCSTTSGEERRVQLDANADPSDLEGPFDFALVTLEAPHLEEALGPPGRAWFG